MRTIKVEVKNDNAMKLLHDLEINKMISIVKEAVMDSAALPGHEMSLLYFKQWIHNTENDTMISLTEAKSKWEQKKKQLQNLTK